MVGKRQAVEYTQQTTSNHRQSVLFIFLYQFHKHTLNVRVTHFIFSCLCGALIIVVSFCPRQLEDDQGFKEFLSVHQNRSQAPTWANDTVQQRPEGDGEPKKTQSKKKPASDDYLNFDSDQSEDEDEDVEEDEDDDEGW